MFKILIPFFLGIMSGMALTVFYLPFLLKKFLKKEVEGNKELKSLSEIFKKIKNSPFLSDRPFSSLVSGL